MKTDAEDIDYILRIVNRSFPSAELTVRDVLSHWAGLRPLVASVSGRPSDISRNHQIRSPKPGWWDVAGGKLTTYRLMAEQTVECLLEDLTSSVGGSRTANEPLLPSTETAFSGVVPPAISRAAVNHFCANEWTIHLDDIMVRRTSWAYYYASDLDAATRVSRWMAERLGWDEERRVAELDSYRQLPLWPELTRSTIHAPIAQPLASRGCAGH